MPPNLCSRGSKRKTSLSGHKRPTKRVLPNKNNNDNYYEEDEVVTAWTIFQYLGFILIASLQLTSFTSIQARPTKSIILQQRSPVNQFSNPKPTFVKAPSKKEKPKKTLSEKNRKHPSLNQSSRRKVIFFQPPPRQGTPKGTVPGGSRGCSQVTQNRVTALMPKANTSLPDGTQIRWGLTTEEYPSFWFYVPYKSKSIRSTKFSLRDRKNRTLYETPIKLIGTPGIISVSLPKNEQPLLNNQWYRLYLLLDISCPGNISAPEKDIAKAWILRETLTPEVKNDLDKAKTLQKAIIYAKNGIWAEALTTTAKLRFLDPNDTQWNNLLESAKLGKLANEKILDCCDP